MKEQLTIPAGTAVAAAEMAAAGAAAVAGQGKKGEVL